MQDGWSSDQPFCTTRATESQQLAGLAVEDSADDPSCLVEGRDFDPLTVERVRIGDEARSGAAHLDRLTVRLRRGTGERAVRGNERYRENQCEKPHGALSLSSLVECKGG